MTVGLGAPTVRLALEKEVSNEEDTMAVAKVIEINAASNESFEDAINAGISKASETVHNIRGAWVKEQQVTVDEGKIAEYRVDLKLSFVLD